MLLLFALACTPDPPGTAATGSRSADLAIRAGEVARRAQIMATRTAEIEGAIDEYRTADPARRAALSAQIHTIALDVQEQAHELQDRVFAMEADARAWPTPEEPAPR